MSPVLVQRSIFDRLVRTYDLGVTVEGGRGFITHRGVLLCALPKDAA